MNPEAIVIGSGFGGIALALRLQSAGCQTLILEKRDKPGGRAYVYEKNGFTFDAGPTVITDPTCLQELFSLSGSRMEDYVTLLPVSPLYQLCWEDGTRFAYVNDQDELERQIAALRPEDVEGYRKFLAYSNELFQEGYVKLGHVPFLHFKDMVKAAPQLMRLKSYQNVYQTVSQYVKNPYLRQAFSFHPLLVGGNPFETSAIYALIHSIERQWGVFYPRGGTGQLIQGLLKRFTELGGEIRLNAPVEEICMQHDEVIGVKIEGGDTIPCKQVASNADVIHTYKNLLSHSRKGRKTSKNLQSKRFSMSLFVIYFGLRGDYSDIQHHTIMFGPRYKELVNDIFKRDGLADDFSLYLHKPTATDLTMAPEGCSSFYVLSPVPHLGTASIDWDVVGPQYRDRILNYLEANYLPGLQENLMTSRIFTPFDFQDELNAHLGSAFSLEPILTQSAYFRTHNRDRDIKGLYIVGAGTHPGAGVPGVVGSAKATAGLMLNDASSSGRLIQPKAFVGTPG